MKTTNNMKWTLMAGLLAVLSVMLPMASQAQRFTDLPARSVVGAEDIFAFSYWNGSGFESRKITGANFFSSLSALASTTPINKGGTGATTAIGALNNLMAGMGYPAAGDLAYYDGSNWAKLSLSSTGESTAVLMKMTPSTFSWQPLPANLPSNPSLASVLYNSGSGASWVSELQLFPGYSGDSEPGTRYHQLGFQNDWGYLKWEVNEAGRMRLSQSLDSVITTANIALPATAGVYDLQWPSYSGTLAAHPTMASNAGKVLAVNGTEDGTEWIAAGGLPSQTGNTGKYLTTDGSAVSWATVDSLPSQTGNTGKYLTTDGSAASWGTVVSVPSMSTASGKYLTNDGSTPSWATLTGVPTISGNTGKVLTNDGTYPTWAAGVITIANGFKRVGSWGAVDNDTALWSDSQYWLYFGNYSMALRSASVSSATEPTLRISYGIGITTGLANNTPTLYLMAPATATLQLGIADTVVNNSYFKVAATTGTNAVGAKLSIYPGNGTGDQGGGELIFGYYPPGSSGTTPATATQGMILRNDGVLRINNVTTAPASAATGAGLLYVEGGALKFKGSSGTVTTIAAP